MMWFNSWLQSWQKCFDYDGRSTRYEFWVFVFLNIILLVSLGYLVMAYSVAVGSYNGDAYAATLQAIFLACVLLALLALGIRRMRDVNRSGWWFGALYMLPVMWLLLVEALEPMVSDDIWPLVYMLCLLLCGLPALVILRMCCQPSQRGRALTPFEQVLVEKQDP